MTLNSKLQRLRHQYVHFPHLRSRESYGFTPDCGCSLYAGASHLLKESNNQQPKGLGRNQNNQSQNPTNTTFPPHWFSESKQSKSRDNPGKLITAPLPLSLNKVLVKGAQFARVVATILHHASVNRSNLTAIPKDAFLNCTSTAGGGWERLRIMSMWLLLQRTHIYEGEE